MLALLGEASRKLLETSQRLAFWPAEKWDTAVRQSRRDRCDRSGPPGRGDGRCKSLGLPRRPFHSLRHSHVSALIAAGPDVLVISRRPDTPARSSRWTESRRGSRS